MGDYSKGREKLNWKPTIKFEELVKTMMDADFLCKSNILKK
jgi:GDP-D-mannose dehydratase